MSFQAMTWAVEQRCQNAGQKLVLLMLANHSNGHTGRCTPSHKLLADECSMGVSTLKTHLASLEGAGFLQIIRRKNEDVNLPNQYLLNLDRVSQKQTDVGQNPAEGGPESGRGVGQNLATEQGSFNLEGNQELNQLGKARGRAPMNVSISEPRTSRTTGNPSVGQPAPEKFTLPEWIDREAWKGYEEMRVKIRKPLTDRARVLIVRDLEELCRAGQDAKEVLDVSTKKGWQGVFEVKSKNTGGSWAGRPEPKIQTEEEFVAAAAKHRQDRIAAERRDRESRSMIENGGFLDA
jgi:hypothetical protein